MDWKKTLQKIVAEETGVSWKEWKKIMAAITSDAEMNRMMRAEWNEEPRGTQQQVRDYYNKSKTWFAQTYNNGYGALISIAEHQIPAFGAWHLVFNTLLATPSKVLDYGGGMFKDTAPLVLAGHQVTLAEIEGPVTRVAERFVLETGNAGIAVFPVSCDYPDFGIIYGGIACFEVLEHMQNPVAFTRHLIKYLKKGGPIAMSVSFGAPEHAPYHLAENAHLHPEKWKNALTAMGLDLHWKANDNHMQIWVKK